MYYELLFLLKSAALLHWAYKAFIMEGLLRCSCPTERKTEISPPGKAAQLEMRGVVVFDTVQVSGSLQLRTGI